MCVVVVRTAFCEQNTESWLCFVRAVGMGDIVSEMAEHSYIHAERKREVTETETMLS
jgi:hypothetical protein